VTLVAPSETLGATTSGIEKMLEAGLQTPLSLKEQKQRRHSV